MFRGVFEVNLMALQKREALLTLARKKNNKRKFTLIISWG